MLSERLWVVEYLYEAGDWQPITEHCFLDEAPANAAARRFSDEHNHYRATAYVRAVESRPAMTAEDVSRLTVEACDRAARERESRQASEPAGSPIAVATTLVNRYSHDIRNAALDEAIAVCNAEGDSRLYRVAPKESVDVAVTCAKRIESLKSRPREEEQRG